MTYNWMRFLPIIALLLLCILLWRGLSLEPKKIPSNLINKPFPAVSLPQLNEHQFNQQDLLGKVSIVHVWATWCLTCRSEHSFLMQIRHRVNLIGLIYRDSKSHVSQWLEDFGDPYQSVLFDPDSSATLALGVYGTPETFIIDKKGLIRYKHIGEINERTWPKLLAKIKELEA